MAHRMTRREFAAGAGAATLAVHGFETKTWADDKKTLRFIPQTDVQVLDPIWTTAYVTRNHGYMVFDTLFAIDSKFKPHPQMVEGFEESSDKLNYSFVLRDGLKFHDGQPVRGADCVASVRRWMARDGHRQALAGVLDAAAGFACRFQIAQYAECCCVSCRRTMDNLPFTLGMLPKGGIAVHHPPRMHRLLLVPPATAAIPPSAGPGLVLAQGV